MPVTFVTAIYNIGNKYRSVEKYFDLFEELAKTTVPIFLFLDKGYEEKGKELCEKYKNVTIPRYVSLDLTWLPDTIIYPAQRREDKDTKEYFAVQLEKLALLKEAATRTTSSHLAWIDAGIFHMFKEKERASDILKKIATASWSPTQVYSPGAWPKNETKGIHFLDKIHWRYLGSFLLGPTTAWQTVYEQQKHMVTSYFPRVAWEVNYWYKMDSFTWYSANHDDSLLTNILHLTEPATTTTVTFVTAFYLIPNNEFYKAEAYLKNLEILIQTGVPLLCFLDKSLEKEGSELCKKYRNFKIPRYVELDTSWIPETVLLPNNRNIHKDTKEYFASQLQKTWCVAEASKFVFSSHLAWIDARVIDFFLDKEVAKKYLQKISTLSWPDHILCPGAFSYTTMNTLLDAVCYRYLGEFLLGPSEAWPEFHKNQTECVQRTLPHLVWDTNYWAMVEKFIWYKADHNESMFQNLLPLALNA